MERIVSNTENGIYKGIRDIMSVPASRRINGQKAITIKGVWAYAQRADGMTIYRYNEKEGAWDAFRTILASNT